MLMKSQFRKNLLSGSASALFVVVLLMIPGYNYISAGLPGDMRFIANHWNETAERKYRLRFGVTFSYLNYISKNTPPDAVIIMPPDSVLLDPHGKFKFLKEITVKEWANYFVYPRRLIYEKEKNTNPLYKEATHVAIVNGWGLDKLHHKLKEGVNDAVVPLNF